MTPALSDDDIAALDALPRAVRLVIKRAWGKSVQRPLWVAGQNMGRAVQSAIKLELVTEVRRMGNDRAIVLTPVGFWCGMHLRRQGWPNCEKT